MEELNEYKNSILKQVSRRPGFVAYYLRQYTIDHSISMDNIFNELNCSEDHFIKLSLCRIDPKKSGDLTEDIDSIAQFAEVSPEVLKKYVIGNKIKLPKIARKIIFPLQAWKAVAAVSLLLMASYALFYFSGDYSGTQLAEGPPGFYQGYLDMGDNQEIYLTDSVHGLSAQSDGSKLHVPVDGSNSLRYDQMDPDQVTNGDLHNVRTPRGGEFHLTLSDGSKVWLNAKSKLSYPVRFSDDERLVYLQGEAYFDVEKDPLRTFIVRTNEIDIRVIGTSFNVRAYNNEHEVKATLVEGLVEINKNDTKVVQLSTNSQYIENIKSKKYRIKKVNAKEIAAWKDSEFYFDNAPLDDILKTIGDWYDLDYTFLDDESRQLRFTGKIYRKDPLSKWINLIMQTQRTPIQFKFNRKKLTIGKIKNR